jgi:hypothetical protein
MPLARFAAGFRAVGMRPGVGEGCKCADPILLGADLGLGSSDDQRIHEGLLAVAVLPEPELVAFHLGEVSFGKTLAQLLSHGDNGPGSGTVTG